MLPRTHAPTHTQRERTLVSPFVYMGGTNNALHLQGLHCNRPMLILPPQFTTVYLHMYVEARPNPPPPPNDGRSFGTVLRNAASIMGPSLFFSVTLTLETLHGTASRVFMQAVALDAATAP